ncbi:UNVERIFIED_CONTAM: hypothetical protein PYX00_007002 [Menopon gallinae]|uniref:RRM domain-containing protein n=1 Tax=Menopon gallinae TaxID=328185 RepID=A0AAW2HHB0_9NEOP
MKKSPKNTSVTKTTVKTPVSKTKVKTPKKLSSESASHKKNVRFDCKAKEKEHVKYIPTPFSSSVKKEGKAKKKVKNIENKKKLSFDEEDETVEVRKTVKRKLEPEETENLPESQQVKKRKKKEVITEKSGENEAENEVKGKDFDIRKLDKKDHTIFVGNIPASYDHKKVQKLFNKFGPVETARIRCVAVANMNMSKKTSAITKKFHESRNSVSAYVVFKLKESVEKAVAQNGMLLDGHHLRIDYAEPQKRQDIKKSVFVGGLPFDIEDDELWETFENCGEIESVRVVRDNAIGMAKGFGYVNFKSPAAVELALKLNNHEIKKRKINVQRCKREKKKKTNMKKKLDHNKMKIKVGDSVPKSAVLKKQHSKVKPTAKPDAGAFQGKMAEKKKKKKSKPTKDTIRKNKIKTALLSNKKKD